MDRRWWDQKGIDWKTSKERSAETDSESESEMESEAEVEVETEPERKEEERSKVERNEAAQVSTPGNYRPRRRIVEKYKIVKQYIKPESSDCIAAVMGWNNTTQ